MSERLAQGKMKLTSLSLVTTCLVVIAIGSMAGAVDYYDPPWGADLPYQTSQAWEFATGESLDPTRVDNQFGTPLLTMDVAFTWEVIDGPEGEPINTLHIDESADVSITIEIPNRPEPNDEKWIFWQMTADQAPCPNTPVSNPPGVSSTPYPNVQWPVDNWYTYNGLIRIPGNPPMELLLIQFPPSANIEEIVVKTICIPEPATLALLALGAVATIRRR